MKLEKRQYFFCKSDIPMTRNSFLKFGDYNLYYGEGLDIENVQDETISLLLIGYMLDPHSTTGSNKDALLKIKRRISSGQSIFEATSEFGGRWILVSRVNNELIALNDACGLRQVFYAFKNSKLVFASKEKIIANFLSLEKDNLAIDYIKKAKELSKEYSWPLRASEYKGIKRLLPNHYIQECSMRVERFWPNEENDTSTNDDLVFDSSSMIEKMIKAANYRKKLAVTLTAGLDTRLLIAGCKGILSEIKVVTLLYGHENELIDDIVIPRKLCEDFDIDHALIKCNNYMTKGFEKDFYKHNEHGHSYWGPMFETINKNQLGDYLWVKGSCCEIARNPFGVIKNKHVTSKLLCDLFEIPYNDFSSKYIDEWLNEAKPICKLNNYYLLDLFYWEHRMGSWQAMCQNEADIVQETFTPFNSRQLLVKLLKADNKERSAPNYKFFLDIVATLDSQALLYPINPKRNKSFFRRQLTKIKLIFPLIYLFLRRLKNSKF